MRTLVYEIADHDVMETFFGENPRTKPITEIARDHAELIFDGDIDPIADCGDVLGIDSDEEIGKDGQDNPVFRPNEYIILVRYVHADANVLYLLVHQRHQVEVELS